VALLGARRAGAQPSDVETAYAIAALGKIGRPGTARAGEETCALDEIARRLDPRANSSADVRRDGVIALGQIGPSCPPAALRDVVATLETSAVDSIDAQERHYAVVALGRIGGARGADAATRKRIGKFLVRRLGDRSAQTPAFAALALGLVGRGIVAEGGAAPEEEIRAPLRAKFKEGGDPEILGAFALASGLVKDALAVEALLATLEDDGADKRVRGWAALALGLIGAPEAAPAVRSALTRETDYELRLHAAMAAALLRDPAAIPDVVEVLRDKDASNYELGSALLALGQFGDERAVDALLEIAGDTKGRWRPETRSVAVAALGRIGDRRDAPSLARVTADVDYRSNVPAIAELLSIL
jgi:HEAT repeat protein